MKVLEAFRRLGRREFVFLAALLLAATPSRAETNSWIKATDGLWQEQTSWSLGILPDSSQSVAITNDGEKTITINSEAAKDFSASLVVNNITISGTNTLCLDHIGTNVPLQIINRSPYTSGSSDFVLAKDAALMNFGSGLVIGTNGGHGLRSSGKILLDGGYIDLRSPGYVGGECLLSNALFTALGFFNFSGIFNQHGGNARFGDLELEGTYNFYEGDFSSGVLYLGRWGSSGSFSQHGGTNHVGSLTMYPPCCGAPSLNFSLNEGTFFTGDISLGPGSSFSQSNATTIVTNRLIIHGDYTSHFATAATPAIFALVNGILTAQTVTIGRTGSTFRQHGGEVIISQALEFANSGGGMGPPGSLSLDAGTLRCESVSTSVGAVNISQASGDFIVSNLFQFAGYYAYYPCYYCNTQTVGFACYDFSGGTLYASNIDLAAEMIIGSSTQTGRITNSGYFKMSGTLTSGNATKQLGRFILASNSVINLGDGSAKLAFANSSAEVWDSAAKLFVTNWNGSLNGGGDDQLKFGNDASALTAAQLNQIRFVNPAGFPSGEFLAQILDMGEVVPKPSPAISFGQSGTNFVLSWSSDFTLQTATNVSGPYEDLTGAISPYTNFSQSIPERYFRLRR